MARVCSPCVEFLHADVTEEDFALLRLVDLQAEEAFSIGAVVNPVGRRDAIDPGLHDVAFGLDRETVPVLGLDSFANGFVFR